MYCGLEGIVALTIAILSDNIDSQEAAFIELDRRLEGKKGRNRIDYDQLIYLNETGMSPEDIAKMLGVKRQTVISYICRARKKQNKIQI